MHKNQTNAWIKTRNKIVFKWRREKKTHTHNLLTFNSPSINQPPNFTKCMKTNKHMVIYVFISGDATPFFIDIDKPILRPIIYKHCWPSILINFSHKICDIIRCLAPIKEGLVTIKRILSFYANEKQNKCF